ncbi:unnamed protein product [Brachionus calyciflorus]|uniref:Uncharacterized protein n=1 Tax=Brachionus calyciflorus TaxID=104777 RepID=A0A813WGB8_9BILA|nr:unnamed protein product [Brachionus calyciflorus]
MKKKYEKKDKMWYWTLPSLVLTGAMLFLPGYINAAGNWIATGHVHRRNYEVDHRDFYLYMRDRRVTGSEYKQTGLDSLDQPLSLSGLNHLLTKERLAVPQQP